MPIIGVGVSDTDPCTLLSIVQQACARFNVPIPVSVMGSISDTQVAQMVGLLQEEGVDLLRRGVWEGTTFETTFLTSAAENQGTMTALATNGFAYIRNQTFWDRSTQLPVRGPLSDVQWAALKGVVTTGLPYYYRIRGGTLLVNPVPTAGLTWAFEYASRNWILGADGITYKQVFTLDTDTVLLPCHLVIQGLRWRWKKEKGLDYAEDFRTYETQVKDALGRDGGKPVLSMSAGPYERQPGICVPLYSWNIP